MVNWNFTWLSLADDPAKDETKKRVFGSIENRGKGSGTRPYFNPEEVKILITSSTDEAINVGTAASVAAEDSLDAPTNCCMSGCPNCVWIEYVERLVKYYSNPELTKTKVLEELDKLEDENIKAFIRMELRYRRLIWESL